MAAAKPVQQVRQFVGNRDLYKWLLRRADGKIGATWAETPKAALEKASKSGFEAVAAEPFTEQMQDEAFSSSLHQMFGNQRPRAK